MTNRAEHLFARAREMGDKVALIFEGKRVTFADLAQRVRQTAGALDAGHRARRARRRDDPKLA